MRSMIRRSATADAPARCRHGVLAGPGRGAPAMAADPVEQFYAGKTIHLVIGFGPGGGYDVYGRVLARHLGRHIPGNPTIVPQNMPGAGSLRSAGWLYTAAAKDGTVIGTFARGIAMDALLDPDNRQFDARKFNWLGSVTNEVSVCAFGRDSGIRTWNDMVTKDYHGRQLRAPPTTPASMPMCCAADLPRQAEAGQRLSGHRRHPARGRARRARRPVRLVVEHAQEPQQVAVRTPAPSRVAVQLGLSPHEDLPACR